MQPPIDPDGIFTLAEVKLVFENHRAGWLPYALFQSKAQGRGSLFAAFADGRRESMGYMPRDRVEYIAGGGGFHLPWLQMVDEYDPNREFVVFIMYRVTGDAGPQFDATCFKVTVS